MLLLSGHSQPCEKILIWNRSLGALALAALSLALIAFVGYRGGWIASPAPTPASSQASPEVAVVVVKKKSSHAAAKKTPVEKAVPYVRGQRLREKGEALGGGRDAPTEAHAQEAGR
jgi:hypothetical protein